MNKLVFIAVVVPALPAFAQETDSIATACDAFSNAWVARDTKAIQSMLTSDARMFAADGDLSGLTGVMRGINRFFKGVKSSETIVDRQINEVGDSAMVTVVSRVDHTKDKRMFSTAQRQSQFWLKVGGRWKLAHLHLSEYKNFATAITAFEMVDKAAMPEPGGVVFVGSSSIRMWKSLKEDFPNTNTVHRGYGGSQLVDSIMYAHRIITPYAPSKVVVYAGDNDVAAGKSAERVLRDFQTLVASIHSRVPEAKVGFVAIKPSRSRWHLWPEMDKANKLVAKLAESDPKVTYLDIATPMLGENNSKPAKDWFIADGLHMKPKGYEAWTKVVRPWVESE